jgi:CO/xanthine dehydrogenase FAD-binding subunit
MEVLLPRGLEEALEMKAAHPEAVPIAGGTDLMVDLNFDRTRPELLIDVSRLGELDTWRQEDGYLFVGAGVTYTRALNELPQMRALAQASRSVGSPQIRNRGTIGGNLGTASPAGDAVPVLVAHDGEVVLVSAGDRTRSVPWNEFFQGPKRNAIAPDELILGARWKVARGPQSFSKVGTRNAMVIAVANLCLVMDEDARTVRVAIGSVGPTVLRAREAESFVGEAMVRAGAWDDPSTSLQSEDVDGFGERVSAAAAPIDDVRGTAGYRRHACRVLARRAMSWALAERAADAQLE